MDFKRAAFIKGATASVLVILVLSFVLFVAFRNDWAVNMDDLSGAVKKAFGTRTVEEQQEFLLVQLDVTPAKVFKRKLKNGKFVTVVVGDIQNISKYPMERVFVEGRLLDGAKVVQKTTNPVPCGKTTPKGAIGNMGKKQLDAFYMDGEQPFNCVIKSGSTAPFMVVFETLPSNFSSSFQFEVHPHSGQFLE